MNNCPDHNKKYKNICFDCNVLMCVACAPQHRDHSFDHINNIREQINININNNNNNNNNNNDNNNYYKDSPTFLNIQSTMESTFNSLKSSVKEFQQLQLTEDEITNRFKELHEFLAIEEHKLKKPIIKNKDQLEHQIEQNIQIMKSLNSINSHFINDVIEDVDDVEASLSSHFSSTSSACTFLPDTAIATTDRYQIKTIIETISQSSNHTEFIQLNNNSIFSLADHKFDDQSLLNLLVEHNILKLNHIQLNQFEQYQLTTNHHQLDQFKNQFQIIFKLKSLTHPNKPSFIFSTDTNHKLSIINITDRNNIHFDYVIDIPEIEEAFLYYTAVTVNENVYRFRGNNKPIKSILKYSTTTKAFIPFQIKGIEVCGDPSVCYDDKDHIYLIYSITNSTKDKDNSLIYRFNIHTLQFERYSTILKCVAHHHFIFHFKNCIYSVIPDAKKIIKFDIDTKITIDLPINLPKYPKRAACTDGKGNIYILSENRFERINIERYEVKQLDRSFFGILSHRLVYHQANDNESYIYSLQGKNSNFMYSVELNKWEPILHNDQSSRKGANTLFQL
ncbi:hypothetical protein PPL_07630 [Heterostelium album PN500]|uniref:B box-type domain-containing protein n=1 Tax=Heterostelium pallidum (strain ATCC 26659 / Pp 5 / PN500) TaxID=670386 RepID=D3BGH9_HETP5|nr:hypothetical protein PPL_07630 [Heterostelium album PN500]EFA79579.1 hypothetical protein PPL_07630 [Heterostelium album PN500]|eukprot:XP_020431700.1 hypothetical protein PPL_07630 [Heterostelium album PN500]